MQRRIAWLLIGISIAWLSSAARPAAAQCGAWKEGYSIAGMSDSVRALVEYDDGSGPALYAAGDFAVAGGVIVNYVAKWTGTTWAPLGTGMNGYVQTLVVYNGELIAGGDFTSAGGVACNRIARWNGSFWGPLGNGMNLPVVALTVYNDELVAGGNFTSAGGVSCDRIASWNGANWTPLDSGMDDGVSVLAVRNNELIAGGWFTTAGGVTCNKIARWNGSLWAPLGDGMNQAVHALTVYNDELVAGGYFTTAGGVSCRFIARWNGSSWTPLGSGMDNSVNALTVYNGELIAGGYFALAGGVTCWYVAQWNGSSWAALDAGMDHGVHALSIYSSRLIAGGRFTSASGVASGRVAQWDGSIWESFDTASGSGLGQSARCVVIHDGELIAGGSFTTAGGISCNRIARWSGSGWLPLGSGMNGDVAALGVYNGELIAGGGFGGSGEVSCRRVARWNGSTWTPLGDGVEGWVCAVAVYSGDLIAGGGFTTASGVACNRIARWNGSNWAALGSGMDNYVLALTVYNGELIAGGYFTVAGGVSCQGVARWDGSNWSPLGSGIDGSGVWALTVYSGELIIAGNFAIAGGVSCNSVARWNGSAWAPLGNGMDSWVYGLTVHDGSLIAGGTFLTAGGITCSRVARWDGSTWGPLGSGMDSYDFGYVMALAEFDSDGSGPAPASLFAGGEFELAGGKPSAFIAEWRPIPNPPVLYVDAYAPAAGDGTSWSSAYKHLQDAVRVAVDCGGVVEIRIASGSYYPDRDADHPTGTGDRTATFQLVNGVTIAGGYAGFGAADPDARNTELYETILSGDLAGNDGPGFANNDENSYNVVRGSGTDATAILDGCTINSGNADGSSSSTDDGGGIYCGSGSSTIINCKISGNWADDYGAGVYCSGSPSLIGCVIRDNSVGRFGAGVYCGENSQPSLLDCVIQGNRAEQGWGGGVLCFVDSNPTLIRCTLWGNHAMFGGGVHSYDSDSGATLLNCRIAANTAYDGAGVYSWASRPSLTNCTITCNSADRWGGGLYCASNGNPTLLNCTVCENAAVDLGGDVCSNYYNAVPTLRDCIVWSSGGARVYFDASSAPVVSYCNLQGGTGQPWFGVGCIDTDPLFIDADGPDNDPNTWADNDYRLATGSPCIDAGDNAAVPLDTLDLDDDGDTSEPIPYDLDDHPRFIDDSSIPDTGNGSPPIIDMGAYEADVTLYLFVDAAAAGVGTGGTWADAFVSLQDALANAATAGGVTQILVAGGVYHPDEGTGQTPGDRAATFQLIDGVGLYGGYAGSANPANPGLRDIALYETILSGDIGVPGQTSDNSSHVVSGTGVYGTTVLDGFTIAAGNAEESPYGAGFVSLSGGATLRHCQFVANQAPCSADLDLSGASMILSDLSLGLDSAPGEQTLGWSNSVVQMWEDVSLAGGELEVYSCQLTGSSLQLADATLLRIKDVAPCAAEVAVGVSGTLQSTPVFLSLLDQWYIANAPLTDVVMMGNRVVWGIAPSFCGCTARLRWVGSVLDVDLSAGGRAEAIFKAGGTLTIEGPVYDLLASPTAPPLYDGLLLKASVGAFHLRETLPASNVLQFVGDPPVLTPLEGFLLSNEQGFRVTGEQILSAAFAPAPVLTDFLSDISLIGNSQISLSPLVPPQGITALSCNLSGTGDVLIDAGAQLLVTAGAVVDLSGEAGGGCADPGQSAGWGRIYVNGQLLVQDSTVRNTNVDILAGDLSDAATIYNNEIRLLQQPPGWGGRFFVEGSSTIECNVIYSEGDRYLDLDPEPNVMPHPTIGQNKIWVNILQGTATEQGELLELRAQDHDSAVGGGMSGAHQLASSTGYADTWVLEQLEVQPNAKVNLTNRQGFVFQDPGITIPEAIYVKQVKLHPNAVLNTGMQRLYYQTLVNENGEALDRDPSDPSAPLANGSRIVDVPLLGFSLKVIAMEDETSPPSDEFTVRVQRRLRDQADEQPAAPPYMEGLITRETAPDDPDNAAMRMLTHAPEMLPAASVSAHGAFARAGEDEIIVAFDYLFCGQPTDELIVYLSDSPEVGNPASADPAHFVEVARVYPPLPGRAGSIGSDQFASFFGTFPRGSLNFTRGTYVELELRGPDAGVWIDNWDPQVQCLTPTCGDFDADYAASGVDFLYVLGEYGSMLTTTHPKWCLDRASGDHYVDVGDVYTWDTRLHDPTLLNLCGDGGSKSGGGDKDGPRGMPVTLPGDALVIAGKQGGREAGVGQQDDFLYAKDPAQVSVQLNGAAATTIIDPNTCLDSPLSPASDPNAQGHYRGNGRLAADANGTIHQLHGSQGLIRLSDAAHVVPYGQVTFEGQTVQVGVNPADGGGVVLADAVFSPTSATTVYVAPVRVTASGYPAYRAAAKLALLESGSPPYTVQQLYGLNPRTDERVTVSTVYGQPVFEPDFQHLREVEVDAWGNLFVLSAQADNDNDWVLVYDEATGNPSEVCILLSGGAPSCCGFVGSDLQGPTAMALSADGGTLYLASSVNDPEATSTSVHRLAIQRDGGQQVIGLSLAGTVDVQGMRQVSALLERPPTTDLWVLGTMSPVFVEETTFHTDCGMNPNCEVPMSPLLAVVPPGVTTATAAALDCHDLALPISVLFTGAGSIPCGTGDFDGGGLGVSDIPLFVNALLLTNPPPEVVCTGDMNRDDVLDGRDVQGFVGVLLGG